MRKSILSLMALASLTMASTSAFTNLGDTKTQSIERYGDVTSAEGNWIYFTGKKWQAGEWINPENGLVEYITWTKRDGAFSEDEILGVMTNNLPAKYLSNTAWVQGNQERVYGGNFYSVMFSNDLKYHEENGITTDGNAYFSVGTQRAKLAIGAEDYVKEHRSEFFADESTGWSNPLWNPNWQSMEDYEGAPEAFPIVHGYHWVRSDDPKFGWRLVKYSTKTKTLKPIRKK
jgi:hypothetical protein